MSTAASIRPKRYSDWLLSHPVISFAVISFVYVLILYSRALTAGFSAYDDPNQITQNPSIHSIRQSLTYFTHTVPFTSDLLGVKSSMYRPLYWLSLAIDEKVWGLHAIGFHLTSVGLHWLTGLLLFVLLRKLRMPVLTAAGSVLLWYSMPINSEAVVWTSDRAYCLAGFFLILSGLSAHGYLVSRKWPALLFYLLCFFAAMLTHEVGILTVPLVLLIACATPSRSRRSSTVLGIASLAPLIGFLVLRNSLPDATPLTLGNLWPAGLYFAKYVSWIFLPIHMSVERSSSTPPAGFSILALIAWLGLVAFGWVAMALRRIAPGLSAGIAWLLLALLPFCGFTIIYQGMAERFAYFASAGAAMIVTSFAATTYSIMKRSTNRKIVLNTALLAAIAAWSIWSVIRLWHRENDWHDSIALYQSSLLATPQSAKLYHNLGDVYLSRGDLEEARASYSRGLDISPGDAGLAINLGVTLDRKGDALGAEQAFIRAIHINPQEDTAYCDLGVLMFQHDQADKAALLFVKAIKLNPADPTPLYDLAAVYQANGRKDLAIQLYRQVLEMLPGDEAATADLRQLEKEPGQHNAAPTQ